jgi:hypothetical protein
MQKASTDRVNPKEEMVQAHEKNLKERVTVETE